MNEPHNIALIRRQTEHGMLWPTATVAVGRDELLALLDLAEAANAYAATLAVANDRWATVALVAVDEALARFNFDAT